MPISILAVDDEQNLLELLLTVLGKRGFAVKTALNGTDALKLVDKSVSTLRFWISKWVR